MPEEKSEEELMKLLSDGPHMPEGVRPVEPDEEAPDDH
jgi:hypothetical protein